MRQTPDRKRLALLILVTGLGVCLLALALAYLSAACSTCGPLLQFGPVSFSGWLSFLTVLLLCAAILYAGWASIQASERTALARANQSRLPGWLAGLLVGAALLRLVMGIVWYLALPQYGHGTAQEQGGYVMADAYKRDQYAQKIGGSDKPLWQAYRSSRAVDAYGGHLLISASIYRYLTDDQAGSLVMVVVSAAFSALAVLFTWAFARRSWDDGVARLAAWGMALYPEVVLLGSSQMREAFLIPAIAASFYGLARLRRSRAWIGLAWLLGGVLLTLLISPPITVVLVLALGLAALAIRDDLINRHVNVPRLAWLALALAAILALLGGYLALRQFAPVEVSNPVDVFSYWLRKAVDLQAYFSKGASGWLQKIFRNTPEWTHLPVLTFYGILRPFLPAALVVPSQAPIWTWITLWRAAGWTILLGLLAYATLHAWLKKGTDNFSRILTIIIWLVMIIASLRGGGDQDDNPRYRAIFASLQISLAAWGWMEQKRSSDPLFRRALVTVIFIMAFSLLWYLRRLYYIPWAEADPFRVIGFGLACGVLYSLWDWARLRRKQR